MPITVNGKEISDAEAAAAVVQADQLRTQVGDLQQQAQVTNAELQRSAQAREAFDQIQRDPAFARQLVDRLGQMHAESAFFRDAGTVEPPAPAGDPAANGGQPVIPPAAPPVPTPNGAVTSAQPPVDMALAREIETLRSRMDADMADRMLAEKRTSIADQFPAVNLDDVIKRAVEERVPLEHLHLVAADIERERLAGVVRQKETSGGLLEQLMSGIPGAANPDEALASMGSSLSSAQLSGDEGVDYGKMSPEDAVLKAFKDVGQPAPA